MNAASNRRAGATMFQYTASTDAAQLNSQMAEASAIKAPNLIDWT
jgi:hypothetical protein